jgi:hypothetical protein
MKGDLMKNNRFIQNLKYQAEENPLAAIAICTAAAAMLLKLMQASTEYNNSKTWEKEVERRRLKDL